MWLGVEELLALWNRWYQVNKPSVPSLLDCALRVGVTRRAAGLWRGRVLVMMSRSEARHRGGSLRHDDHTDVFQARSTVNRPLTINTQSS
jgi:hypothetical protein